MPKRPRSSGPPRKEFGLSSSVIQWAPSVVREAHARGGDEGRDFRFVLEPRRALDARGNIDAAGASLRDRLGDIGGIEAARQQPRAARTEIACEPPIEGKA